VGATLGLLDRKAKEAREERELAPWALKSSASLGRHWPEDPDPLRTAFERDRDRIVHSTAFRRLAYKTQVFINSEGDQYRTRMSHSLEVWQVARSLSSALRLNETFCEALSLAHDIGHPPFGHRGEWALDELLKDHGGFRHNAQVLRVVDQLERRSPSNPGLNLTREVHESLLKHESARDWPAELEPRPSRPWLETQVVDLADSTAYDKHDLEDGLHAGMFSEAEVREGSSLWRECEAAVAERHPGFLAETTDGKLRIARIANELMGACIQDILRASAEKLAEAGPDSPAAVRALSHTLVTHGVEMKARVAELQTFLHQRFYRHEHLQRLRDFAYEVLAGLYAAYVRCPDELAPWYLEWADTAGLERSVGDYLAGMTDRFAVSEFERLVDAEGPRTKLA
jgi:dGTPase